MRKEKNFQSLAIIALSVALVIMAVGYAAYTQTLNINGSATFTASKWDVHFNTTTFNETTTIKAASKDVGNTTITYDVTLQKPGDEYSFTVDAKNFGTIDAVMQKVTMSGLTAAQKKYITYKVSYNGTEYTETTSGLNVALAAGTSHTVVVTVKYELPSNASELPTEDTTVSLTASFDYVDAA